MTRRIPLPEGWQPVEIVRSRPDPRPEGETDGPTKPLDAEARQRERERIRELDAIDAPGYEDMIEEAKRDPQATADSVCREIAQDWARIGRSYRHHLKGGDDGLP